MNIKRFVSASISVFLSFQVLDGIIHNFLLSSAYEALNTIWRPDMMEKIWIIFLTSFIFSFLFVYIFIKGYEGKGIKEGIRYGILIGLLMNIAGIFNQYVVYPIPFSLAAQWFVYGTFEIVVCGIVASLIYRNK
ncbi:MAG: hypothetical protein A2314_00835 [Elusimicrobia bacterium RIFOXYB2_FULL_50_12]|nr:MAG: hypothetical protein A2314_00835 [Elusimicrobia bacterium RIFOXYB2_FULL_50_12]